MFSIFLISFFGGDGSSCFGLSSKDAEGEAEWGGEAGGEEGGLDLGVKERKADGPVGECIEEAMEVFSEEVGRETGEWRE